MDLSEKVVQIKEKREKLNDRKIRIEERLDTEQKTLASLVKQIQEKGFDPKELKKIKEQKEKELQNLVSKIEQEFQKAEEILKEIESKDAKAS